MRLIQIIIILFFSFAAFASPKVALLVSLDNPKHRPLFKTKKWKLSSELIEYFQKKMEKAPYELVIFDQADQETLHKELMNPDNIALFWISHAGSFKNKESGLGMEDVISDFYGKNLKDIFQLIHPNLRYLSVLGCKAEPILNTIKTAGFYEHNNELHIYAKTKNIFPKTEIRRSIDDFKKKFSTFSDINQSCPTHKGYPLHITRTIPLTVDPLGQETAVKILNRGRLLGLFPKAKPGETQSRTVYLTAESNYRAQDLKIVVDSGELSKDNPQLIGSFEISSPALNGNWKAFQDGDGNILGVTHNVYRFSGRPEIFQEATSFSSFDCN